MKNKTSIKKTLPNKIADTLILYVKTQFVLVVLATVASWMLLSFLGVRYPLLLAILTGASSVTPVLGMTIAAIIVGIVAVFDGVRFLPHLPEVVEGLVILVVYGLFNILIDYFLSPYLTGKITKVHPLIMLLAVIVGTAFFGIPGALLGVPAVLVTKTIVDHYKEL